MFYCPGHPSVSGTAAAGRVTIQYSTATRAPAGSPPEHRGLEERPRSIISRRDSGKGETPNSIPRVSTAPFHGGWERLWCSSQMPIHGKVGAAPDITERQPERGREGHEELACSCRRAHQMSRVGARAGCARVRPGQVGRAAGRRRVPGQSNSGAGCEIVGRAERALRRPVDCVADARKLVCALLEERRAEGDVLRPTDRPIVARHVLAPVRGHDHRRRRGRRRRARSRARRTGSTAAASRSAPAGRLSARYRTRR